MFLCPRCGHTMNEVMHFSKDKNYKNKECKHCHYTTRPNRIKFNDTTQKNNIKNNKIIKNRT